MPPRGIMLPLGKWISATPTQPPPSDDLIWTPWRAFDGGHHNGVEICPYDSNKMVTYTDVAGIGFSSNKGVDWDMRNRWIGNTPMRCVASGKFAYDGINYNGQVYFLCGDGSSGGVAKSTDFGASSTIVSTKPFGHGNNTSQNGLPNPHPRSTGRLVDLDLITAGGYMYVGTFKSGVMRAPLTNLTDSGWITIGHHTSLGGAFAGKTFYIRSLCLGRKADGTVDPDVLYVVEHSGVSGGGPGHVWRTTNPRATPPTWTEFTGIVDIEELLPISDTTLLGAKWDGGTLPGANGIYRLANPKTAVAGATWSNRSAGIINNDRIYSLDGFKDTDGFTYIVVSTDQVVPTTKQPYWYASSADEFATLGTWIPSPVGTSANFHNDMGGYVGNPTPRPFWNWGQKFTQGEGPFGKPVMDPNNKSRIYVGGRVLHCAQGGQPTSSQHVFIYCYGDQMLNVRDVAIDPNNPDRFFWAGLDSTFISSADAGVTCVQDRPPGALSSGGDASALVHDPYINPSPIYGSTGFSASIPSAPSPPATGRFFCEIWRGDNPYTVGHNWTRVKDATNSLGGDPVVSDLMVTGLWITRNPATGVKYLLLAVRGDGVWYMDTAVPGTLFKASSTPVGADGDIMKSSTGMAGLGQQRARFRSSLNSQHVFLMDTATGWWYSGNYGISGWYRIKRDISNAEGQGGIIVNPNDSNIIYIGNPTTNTTQKITNATTVGIDAASGTNVEISLAMPGPMGLTPSGKMYVAGRFAGSGPQFMQATINDDTHWFDRSASVTHELGWSPVEMACGSDGGGVLGLRGNGVLVWKPA